MIIRHRTPPGVMAAPISNLAESRIAPMKVQGTLPYGSPGLTGEQGSASSRVGRTASSSMRRFGTGIRMPLPTPFRAEQNEMQLAVIYRRS
jgi:hypothetical protein